jgi:hypothetical protein
MTLWTAEGIGEVHVHINEAGNYETVSCIDDEIGWTARKLLANCIDTGPSKSDVIIATHVIGGVDDHPSPDQYSFVSHL